MTGFKKGDWCFHEFQLKKIKEAEGGNVKSVTDGFFETSSNSLNDTCFPMTLEIKVVSDEFAFWEKRLRDEAKEIRNWPDLHRELVSRWAITCHMADDNEHVEEKFRELADFCNTILRKCRDIGHEEVEGIRIFK
jgi:hypothetical protein